VRGQAFSGGQLLGAATLACLVQGALVGVLFMAHSAGAFVPKPEPRVREMAIAVKPMVDLPLLKKGGKPRPNKLPDMWKPPQQVKRVEKKPVPTVAPKSPEPAPKVEKEKEKEPPPKPDEKPPPPDTPVAQQVDETVKQVEREVEEPNLPEEGAVDGVEEGTEKDPLKARAVDLYKNKLINWFKQGFVPPVDEVGCATLVELKGSVTAQVGDDGTVVSYTLVPSGNAVFDESVRRAMDAKVGQPVPPPPPNYPDLLERSVHPTFQGKNEKCK
jgi:hypothetical protein